MSQDAVPQSDVAEKLDAGCGKAMELQLAGQLGLAEQLYRAVLQADARHAAANYGLGMLHLHCKRPAEGLHHLLAALHSMPDTSDYWLGYLEALLLAGRLDEARSTLNQGRQHGLTGDAVDEFAVRLASKSPPPAAASAPSAPAKVKRRAGRNEALLVRKRESNLLTMVKRGQFTEASALARLMTQRHPDRGLGWKVLGAIVSANGSHEESIAAMQTAAQLMPRDAEVRVNLGLTLVKLQRFDEAERCLREALDIKPGFATAYFRLSLNYESQGRFAEAEASLRRGLELRTDFIAGDDELNFSNLLFLVSHNPAVDADALFAEHRRFGDSFEKQLRAVWPSHSNSRNPDRRIKVAFVSGDLHDHAVCSFLEPILLALKDRSGFELHAYYNNSVEDEVSKRLAGYFAGWHLVARLSHIRLSEKILHDGIDILIDLSGHTGLNRLPTFARKPAPIQVSWMGYPGTTGLEAMDYYLTDSHFLPPGRFDRHFTEKLVYLPADESFEPFSRAPPVNDLPALARGYLTFGSFNRLGKMNSMVIGLWANLLQAIPGAKMLIAGIVLQSGQRRLTEELIAAGVARERLTLHPRYTMAKYLELYHDVDICLDTLPYSGGTTTVHALWMGVPTLTLDGSTPAGRQGAAIMTRAGLDGFVASNPDDFVTKGVHWASHLAEMSAVRSALRERRSRAPHTAQESAAHPLEPALRHMWRRWCAGLPAESFEIGGLGR